MALFAKASSAPYNKFGTSPSKIATGDFSVFVGRISLTDESAKNRTAFFRMEKRREDVADAKISFS